MNKNLDPQPAETNLHKPNPEEWLEHILESAIFQEIDQKWLECEISSNNMMNASLGLIALCIHLRDFSDCGDIDSVRTEIAHEIIALKYRIAELDYPPSVSENLCLLFAIVIDEFIMNSQWGRDKNWENLTLVSYLFGIRNGGQQFYSIANRALLQ